MNVILKKIALAVATVMLPCASVHALDVGKSYEKDNVRYYTTASNVVEVRGAVSGYTGAITIPATVKLGGVLGIGATECTVEAIHDDAFKNSSVTSINMSGATNLKSIGKYAFAFNSSITSITFPTNSTSVFTSLPEGLFYDCSKLTTLTNLPTAITSIGYSCYRGTALATITVPATVTSIGGYAFAENTKLTRVNYNTHMTEIPDGAFRGCSALRPVMLTLYRVNGVSPVTRVGESAFWGATSMTVLPDGLTKVTNWGDRCFYASGLQEISLNENTTYVGYDCFRQCTALKKIYSPIANPDEVYNNDLRLGYGMFYLANVDECRMYVPVGSEKAYHDGIAASITHLIAQGTLAEVLEKAEDPETSDYTYHYLFTENLLVAATPYDTEHMKPYLILKDDNKSINPSVANGREAYPEERQQQAETFDQSNWIAVSVNWSTPFQGKYVRANTMTVTLNNKTNPYGDFASGFNTDASYEEITSAQATGTAEYKPNEFWPANFIYQPEYFFVEPKHMEYATLTKAVYHNGAFFMTAYNDARGNAINPYHLDGSVALDNRLVSDYEFKEGYMYDINGVMAYQAPAAGAISTKEFNPGGETATSGWTIVATEVVRERDGVGDVNLDGEITVADATAIYDVILGVDDTYKDTADTNLDGEYTVGDVTLVYNIILSGK